MVKHATPQITPQHMPIATSPVKRQTFIVDPLGQFLLIIIALHQYYLIPNTWDQVLQYP